MRRLREGFNVAAGFLFPRRYAGIAGQYESYWRLKDRLARQRLKLTALSISNEDKIRGASAAVSVLRHLVLGTLGRAWLAVPFIALAIGLDNAVHVAHAALISYGLHLPGIAAPFANAHIVAVCQILVVVLGLYFAPFSIVASSSLYAQIPEEVREILLRERAVGTFMTSLAIGASYGIAFLALQAIGYTPGYGATLVTAFVGIYCVVAFARYAPALFRLFDPKYLLDPIREDLNRHVEGVTFAGKRHRDSSIQDYHYRSAQRDLSALQHISQLPHSVPMTDAATATFCLDVMAWYASRKDDIPSDSLWWPRRPIHVDWLTTDYQHLMTRVRTLTRMDPDPKPDRFWVERTIARITADCTRRIGQAEAESAFADILNRLSSRARSTAYACCVQECLIVVRTVFDALVDLSQTEWNPLDERQEIVRVGAADAIGVTCANIVLGLHSRLEDLDFDSVRNALDNLRAGKIQHSLWLPQEVRQILERAQNSWGTERAIYGQTVTSAAFVARECEQALSSAFLQRVRRAIAPPRYLLIPLSERIEDPSLRAIVLQGALDVAVRARRLLDKFAERFGMSETIESLVTRSEKDFDDALERLAETALKITGTHDSSLPDFLGQAYHFAAQRAFQSIVRNDRTGVERWFPRLLQLALRGISRVEATVKHQSLTWTNQIIEDLIDLSGYAIVASGVFGEDLWTSMRSSWDEIINEKGQALLKAFGRIVDTKRQLLLGSPRSLLRHEWWLRFRTELQQHGILPADLYGPYVDLVLPHRNPVVAAFTHGGDIEQDELFSIFGLLYVRRRYPEAFEPFERRSEDFSNLLSRVREERRLGRSHVDVSDFEL